MTAATAAYGSRVLVMAGCAEVCAGIFIVEIHSSRRPGESKRIAGVVTINACSSRVVHTLYMAEAAGSSAGRSEMLASSKIGSYGWVMAGAAEIAGAKRCIVVEGGLADRTAGELPGMPAGVCAFMASITCHSCCFVL